MNKAERQWDRFGEENPYFAVVTIDKFKRENLDERILEDFFATGEEYTERIWDDIRKNLKPDFRPKRALDFGCGVGRLAIPISKRSEKTWAVDVSQKMLDEAKKNAAGKNARNIEFVKGIENLSDVREKFDFVHSFIVIQHIDPKVGENIFKRLIDLLDEGGIGALHLTYDHPGTLMSRTRYKIYRAFPRIYAMRNFFLNRTREALIPVYTYNLNRIFDILQKNDCHRCFIRFSEHGHKGIHIFFEKKAGHIY